VKLPLREPEREALRLELAKWDGLVSSALLRAEAVRACGRYGAEYVARAEASLERVALIPIDEPLLEAAGRLDPPELRTLDAVHLATALGLASDLGVLVTYDTRLADAAHAHGLRSVSPA
jgi:predicted nucleic acid-binding protein